MQIERGQRVIVKRADTEPPISSISIATLLYQALSSKPVSQTLFQRRIGDEQNVSERTPADAG